MNREELENKWRDNFPKKYFGGIAVGPGWLPIVDAALTDMLGIVEEAGVDPSRLIFGQIKEKFGGLRIYYDIDNEDFQVECNTVDELIDDLDDVVAIAEKEAWATCDQCSSNENVTTAPWKGSYSGGWILTLCDPCRDKKDRARPS